MPASQEVQAAIYEAAQRYGLDPQDLMRMAEIESGFNPSAKNPNSSAGGLYQFIDGTAQQYGLQDRFDPKQAADAAARLMRDNATGLQRALGRKPTGAELYLAHQQGLGGAMKLLRNPNAPAASVVGDKAVVNNGGNGQMTAGQFANQWLRKFDDGGYSVPGDRQTAPMQQQANPSQQPQQEMGLIPKMMQAFSGPVAGPAAPGILDANQQVKQEEQEDKKGILGRLLSGLVQKNTTPQIPAKMASNGSSLQDMGNGKVLYTSPDGIKTMMDKNGLGQSAYYG